MKFLNLIFIFSLVGNAQNIQELTSLNLDYESYSKNISKSFFHKKSESNNYPNKKIIYGEINTDNPLLNITRKLSFSISSNKKHDKLMAAILHGIKYYSEYEFVADDFEKNTKTKSSLMKELLKIKVFAIPDIRTMKATKKFKISTFENITQFKHEKLKQLKKPIIIYFYANYRENFKEMKKYSKTIIKHNKKVLYSSIKNGDENISINDSKINSQFFIYRINKNDKLMTGGLMNHLIFNLLSKLKDEIHLKSVYIKNVRDFHVNEVRDLKRISSRGKIIMANDLKRFWI